ncbi:MAG: hypothetical protein WB814_04685, partial [Candidatus Sulfotelmatobacter sp.]
LTGKYVPAFCKLPVISAISIFPSLIEKGRLNIFTRAKRGENPLISDNLFSDKTDSGRKRSVD